VVVSELVAPTEAALARIRLTTTLEGLGLVGAVIGGLILHAVTHGAHTSVKIWK
jgi:hypothetical protein